MVLKGYKYNSNDVTFNGTVKLGGSHGLRTVTGQYGSVQTVGSNNGWAGYSIDGRYALMASTTHNAGYGMYDDVHNRWMIYTKHTNGTRYASYDGDSNWDFYSDVRLKENIEKESSILNRIMKLDVVKYDFIGEGKKYKELGFIAQEVEPLFPSIVSEQDDDRHEFKVKSLGYNTFGVIAIGGIKELKNEKDNEIAELRSENESFKIQDGDIDKRNGCAQGGLATPRRRIVLPSWRNWSARLVRVRNKSSIFKMIKRIRNMAVLAFGAIALWQCGTDSFSGCSARIDDLPGLLGRWQWETAGQFVDPLDSTQRVSAPANYDLVFRDL